VVEGMTHVHIALKNIFCVNL